LVNLSSVGEERARLKPSSPEPEFPKSMDPQLKRRLIFFSQMAMSSPDIRKLIDVVYKLASKGKA